MVFSKFTADELSEINRRVIERFRTSNGSAEDEAGLENKRSGWRTAFFQEDDAGALHRAITKDFLKNSSVLPLSINELRSASIAASKKFREEV